MKRFIFTITLCVSIDMNISSKINHKISAQDSSILHKNLEQLHVFWLSNATFNLNFDVSCTVPLTWGLHSAFSKWGPGTIWDALETWLLKMSEGDGDSVDLNPVSQIQQVKTEYGENTRETSKIF